VGTVSRAIAQGPGGLYLQGVAPQGWAEFVAWMQERSAADALDIEAAWEQFRALAATSEQGGLLELAARFDAAPGKDRLALAGTIAGMLAPVEWPVAWRELRQRLASALDELVRVLESQVLGSLAVAHIPTQIRLLNLRLACLLVPSCRRDDLRLLATLCYMGTMSGGDADWRSISVPSAAAFGAYAEAARALNAACGVVLFTELEPRTVEAPA
jgi:hypothetical protein